MDSGKGTLGDVLVNKYGYRQDSWARPLKDAASKIFGWERPLLEGDTKESREYREQVDIFWSQALSDPLFTPRKALQLLGTEASREVFGDSIWTSSLVNRWNKANRVDTVVTDCRFRNELECIRNNGGVVVRVTRGPEPDWWGLIEDYNLGRLPDEEIETVRTLRNSGKLPHVSETDWVGSKFDHIIVNDGSLEDYHHQIDHLIGILNRGSPT
jgi:hypothetical protein